MINRRVLHAICAALIVVAADAQARQLPPAAAQASAGKPAPTPDPRMTEVERLTSEGDWTRAHDLLTEMIAELSSGERTADTERTLSAAYERRAMARLQMGDEANARQDFAALLQGDPDHTLASASPGVAALFSAIRKSTLGLLDLTVRPPDATVTLERDDAPTPVDARVITSGAMWVRPGPYRVSAKRPGHEPVTHAFTAAAGSTERRVLVLTRTSAALFISTTPLGVRVLVDGEPRGTTEAATSGGHESAVLVIDGLVPRDTPYKLTFEKECFVPAAETVLIGSLDASVGTDAADPDRAGPDRTYDRELWPAVGQLHVVADQADAAVWVDGERRGAAATPITDLCEGVHDVEVRGPAGTFANKVTIETARTTRVAAVLVPTFALIPPAKQGATLDRELNARLADAFQTSTAVRLVPAESTSVEPPTGVDSSAAAKRLNVQGIATVQRIAADAAGHDVELLLTAAGSTRPDIIRFRLDDRSSIEGVVKRLDGMLPVSRRSIGVEVIDVLRMDGAVVSAVDPDGPANGLIKPGDVIVGLGPESVATADDLRRVLAQSSGAVVNLRIRDRGTVVPVNVTSRPAILGMHEPDVMFNEAIVELRARLARVQIERPAADQSEATRLRLNLAIALMAVQAWGEAETLLSALAAEPQKGIQAGTLQYLRGVAAKALGRSADARAHFERAAADDKAMLTDRGPLVAYLAKAELRPGPASQR